MVITDEITWLEVAWGLASFIGVLYMAVVLAIAGQDVMWVKRAKINGVREYSAITTLIVYMGGFGTQMCLLTDAVGAMVTRNHVDDYHFFQQSILLFLSIMGSVFAVIIYRRRKHLLDLIKESER